MEEKLNNYQIEIDEFKLISKSPLIKYSNSKIILPMTVVEKIESHWNDLINSGKSFWRGDVLTITGIKDNGDGLQIEVALTDYAHYLATLHEVIDKKYACRVAHSSVMIETLDGYLIFGEMGGDTALPNRIQCIGGGITRGDLMENSLFINIEKNASTEMAEEIGLLVDNKKHISKFFPWSIIKSGPQDVIGIIYWAKTPMSLDDFVAHYIKFEKALIKNGDKPELLRTIHVSGKLKNKKEWLKKVERKFADHLLIIFNNL